MTQVFLGSASARKFLFFYIVVMHLLVSTTLYRFTHQNPACKRILAVQGVPGSPGQPLLHLDDLTTGHSHVTADGHVPLGGVAVVAAQAQSIARSQAMMEKEHGPGAQAEATKAQAAAEKTTAGDAGMVDPLFPRI